MIGQALAGGFRLVELDETTSTNDVVRRHAEAGEPAGLVVTAARQTAGRGRQGRAWLSPSGNLYASLLLRPRRPVAEVSSLSLVIGLALCEFLDGLLEVPRQAAVKWPNDVLVDGAKIAGILLEGSAGQGGACEWVVAGVGVNIASSPGPAVGYATTCLAALGRAATGPRPFLAGFLQHLAPHLHRWDAEGFGGLREGWLARAAGLDREIVLKVGNERVRGRLMGVDEQGALLVATADGRVERFAAGELAIS